MKATKEMRSQIDFVDLGISKDTRKCVENVILSLVILFVIILWIGKYEILAGQANQLMKWVNGQSLRNEDDK